MTHRADGVVRRPIRVLPPALASRIAAGEVIERPASVIKELVENAIDAGARTIRIDVREAGFGLIQVSDDGIGILPEELPLACARHATSKLTENDLGRVQTLGFRGEALPSIAAVAELTITSTPAEHRVGRRLTLRDGRIVVDEPAAHPPGTTVIVKHLFTNVPARLAAAKQKSVEAAQIVQMVRRLALASPFIRFSLALDGRHGLQTSGSGDLLTALTELYDPPIPDAFHQLETVEVAEATVTGAIADPSMTRPGRTHLHIVVNGRWTQPLRVLSAVEAAYRPLLPRGRHPILVLMITLPPEQVDVNVHPAKLEVRLRNEHAIGRAAAELVRNALGRRARTFLVQFPELPSLHTTQVAEPPEPYEHRRILTRHLPPLHIIGQLHNRLILLEGEDGLYAVDQHRAHERILYEQLKSIATEHGKTAIELVEPTVIELSPRQAEKLRPWLTELTRLGFHCETFGRHLFLLRTVPPLVGLFTGQAAEASFPSVGEVEALVPAVLEALTEEPTEDMEQWRERLCVRLACRMAVRRGRTLDLSTMHALVTALGETDTPAVCPHGSPTLLRIDTTTLFKQFNW